MKEMYGLRKECNEHQALEDFIRDVRSPYNIHSDNAKDETSRVWTDIMRKYNIKGTNSECHCPW